MVNNSCDHAVLDPDVRCSYTYGTGSGTATSCTNINNPCLCDGYCVADGACETACENYEPDIGDTGDTGDPGDDITGEEYNEDGYLICPANNPCGCKMSSGEDFCGNTMDGGNCETNESFDCRYTYPYHTGSTGGGTVELDSSYNEDFLQTQAQKMGSYVIGIALAIVVFTIPYLVYLWGSGNPENLKKANQLLGSLLGGLLLVLLANAIIGIIGAEFFSI